MSHPRSLIEQILALLKPAYPPVSHRYEIEKPLDLTDRRFQPDIQVFDSKGDLLCVVEIGYTRPEKLKHYRRLKIPDVRWYSKTGERAERVIRDQRFFETSSLEVARVRISPDGRLTRDGAATYLCVSPKTLANWQLEGKGPRSLKVGGRVFYFQSDLDAFISRTRPDG